MSLILGIETAGEAASCAVGLVNHGEVEILATAEIAEPQMHCENLVPLIQKVFDSESINTQDLGLVAVDVGPGLYTGLRVGIATAMFLAYGLGSTKCAGLSSLDLLAHIYIGNNHVVNETIIPLVDARRGEVFYCIKNTGENFPSALKVANPEELLAEVKKLSSSKIHTVKFIGTPLYADFFKGAGFEYESLHLEAKAVVQLAAQHSIQTEPEDLQPIYLRRPDVG